MFSVILCQLNPLKHTNMLFLMLLLGASGVSGCVDQSGSMREEERRGWEGGRGWVGAERWTSSERGEQFYKSTRSDQLPTVSLCEILKLWKFCVLSPLGRSVTLFSVHQAQVSCTGCVPLMLLVFNRFFKPFWWWWIGEFTVLFHALLFEIRNIEYVDCATYLKYNVNLKNLNSSLTVSNRSARAAGGGLQRRSCSPHRAIKKRFIF